MNTRRPLAFLVSAAIAISLAACGGDETPGPSDVGGGDKPSFAAGTTMERLAQAGKVTVGTKFDQPLFGLKGLSGEPEGFDVEIAKIIAAELGIDAGSIEFIESPSKQREELIEQKKVDFVVATYTINDERKQRITFAGPYYEAGQALMVKADNTTVTGPDSLKDPSIKVCSAIGSTPLENIKQYLADVKEQLKQFDVYSKCADALRNNQVQVVTTDNVILLGLAVESDGAFKLTEGTFSKEPYGIGVFKGDTAFCEFINETLKKASDSGAYAKAWTDTAGTIEGSTTPTLPPADPCA